MLKFCRTLLSRARTSLLPSRWRRQSRPEHLSSPTETLDSGNEPLPPYSLDPKDISPNPPEFALPNKDFKFADKAVPPLIFDPNDGFSSLETINSANGPCQWAFANDGVFSPTWASEVWDGPLLSLAFDPEYPLPTPVHVAREYDPSQISANDPEPFLGNLLQTENLDIGVLRSQLDVGLELASLIYDEPLILEKETTAQVG